MQFYILDIVHMSIPRDHHYLPKFYLDRWAIDGRVFRYVRPTGVQGALEWKRKSPKAIAYERDLYHLPDISDPALSQAVELEFFQKIDDRAAVAISKLDELLPGTVEDRNALASFVISLLHRSPSRLRALRTELSVRTDGAPYEGAEGLQFENILKATTNRLLAMLVDSTEGKAMVSKFRTFKIDVSGASKRLLTSDRPVIVSATLVAPDAFIILPYAPDRLMIMAHTEEVAKCFSAQNPTTLVKGINEAIVEQSEDVIVASNNEALRMIDRLFLRSRKKHSVDTIGLIRRKTPLVDSVPVSGKFDRIENMT